jgi:hypothetical protein
MAVVGFVGTLGAGKTLMMSAVAVALASGSSRRLVSNYGLQGSEVVSSWDDLFAVRDAVVALDELQVLADSRAFKNNLGFTQWLLQSRKVGLDILFTTQHVNQVDLRVRNVLDFVFLLKKERVGRSFRSVYHLIDFQFDAVIRSGVMKHHPRLYRLYDTTRQIEVLM